MKIILIVLMTLFITACSMFDCKDKLPEYVLVVPKDDMIAECNVSKPPNHDDFMRATTMGQMMIMTQAYNNQTRNLNECNARLYGLKIWKEEQVKNYNKQ